MTTPVYETHIIHDPLIPAIFHIDTRECGENQPPNWHTNTEFLLCTEGSGVINCEMVEYPFKKGDLFVINSNDFHSIYTDNNLKYYCMIIDRDFCKDNGLDTNYIRFNKLVHDSTVFDKYIKVTEAFNYFDVCRAIKIRCAILELLIELRTNHTETSLGIADYDRNPNIERIKRAMVYIRQNLEKTLTLDDIANYVGISKFYLTREFKRIAGQTMFEYINTVRCKEAKRLIAGGMSVSVAARSCGFENLSYFSRTYKKHIGSLPKGRSKKEQKA